MPLDKVKIGYKTFDVIPWDEESNKVSGSRRSLGETHFGPSQIFVDTTGKGEETANTLLHEILHGIYHIYNIQQGDEEERVVNTFANGMIQVFQDNPDLLTYLKKATKHAK